MKIMKTVEITLSLAIAASIGMQSTVYSETKSTLVLPKLQRTAESYALGDGAAYLKGLNALGVNPAGLHSGQSEILTQYQQLPLDTDLTYLGFARPFSSLNSTLGFTYLALRSSHFDKRDENGKKLGEFDAQEQVIGFHFSKPLSLNTHNFDFGISAKVLRMSADVHSASAFAFDLGTRYAFRETPLSVGLSFLNIGKGPTLVHKESKLPTSLVLSGAYTLMDPMTLLASFTHGANDNKQEFSMGVQYWVGNIMALRGRYALLKGDESLSGGFHNVAGGFGIKLYKSHTLDYSFQPFASTLRATGAIGTHRITMTFRMGDKPKKDDAITLISKKFEEDHERMLAFNRAFNEKVLEPQVQEIRVEGALPQETLIPEPITAPRPEPVQVVLAEAAPAQEVRLHTVQEGETLWTLADNYYSNGWNWFRVYRANQEEIPDPAIIQPGQKLVIP